MNDNTIINGIIITFLAGDYLYHQYRFSRNKSIKGTAKIDNLIKNESAIKYYDYDERSKARSDSYVFHFIDVLNEKMLQEDLKALNNNIKTLKLKKSPFHSMTLFFEGADQCYQYKRNTIVTNYDNDENGNIYHELFHMASTYNDYNNKICYSGFSIEKGKDKFGIGLTEGYTELLTERYFRGKYKDMPNSYRYAVIYAEEIENLIGQEKMTSLYLNHDLKGLIKELEKYKSKEQIYEFLHETDYIIKEKVGDNPFSPIIGKTDYNRDNFLKINSFLTDCYAKEVHGDNNLTENYIYNLDKKQNRINEMYSYSDKRNEMHIVETTKKKVKQKD